MRVFVLFIWLSLCLTASATYHKAITFIPKLQYLSPIYFPALSLWGVLWGECNRIGCAYLVAIADKKSYLCTVGCVEAAICLSAEP